ncbi:hypothetical protein SDC9_204642 [bioreactor metagenome]|uniref:Uncharacterized protein n=1 Tax=bioreactor metagenome TaxID=1076179 RepID=A0A645J2K8_9ZZZZ
MDLIVVPPVCNGGHVVGKLQGGKQVVRLTDGRRDRISVVPGPPVLFIVLPARQNALRLAA